MIIEIIKIIAIIGFIISIFNLKIGWFIGFFFAGIYILLKDKKQINKINIIFSIISILIAVYGFIIF